ncbi:MAG: ATP-binding protein [Chlamydiae bacterium]|nr:ATP-binding protein [Chlamydiota bacterium]MBI3278097.1 ATP-binding protein [Chlamydiota bacterium]
MISRYLSFKLATLSKGFPAIYVTGPRQSGKTTLVKEFFKNHHYVSLENPNLLEFALRDPTGFLKANPAPCIFDEVQKAPQLLSYLQELIDASPLPGSWILTGSQNFILMERITQTLAGRSAILRLLPLSISEILHQPFQEPVKRLTQIASIPKPKDSLEKFIFKGCYPRLYTQKIDPQDWYASYDQSYVERDVRDVLKIGNLTTFRNFVRLCAGRSGQLLNLSSLANDAGIAQPTAKSWISILEASSLIYLLPGHHKNFSKRLVKSPKLYFLDTGLLSYLLKLRSAEDIPLHPLKGALFETLVVSELVKLFTHAGQEPPLYFWRDHTGNEIDILIDLGKELLPLEIKSSSQVSSDHFKTIRWWFNLKDNSQEQGIIFYGGENSYLRENFIIQPWFQI